MKLIAKLFCFLIIITIICSCSKKLQNSAFETQMSFPEDIEKETTVRSEQIAKHVKTLAYVEKATVTIIGSSALVAVDLNKDYSDKDIIIIKKDIKKKAMLFDVNIKTVTVSVVPHLIDKATGFAGKDGNNRHFMTDELEEITVPTVPTL